MRYDGPRVRMHDRGHGKYETGSTSALGEESFSLVPRGVSEGLIVCFFSRAAWKKGGRQGIGCFYDAP